MVEEQRHWSWSAFAFFFTENPHHPFKGLLHQILLGHFWPTWKGLERKWTSTGLYKFSVAPSIYWAILKFWSVLYQNIAEIPGISKMNFQMRQRFLDISYFLFGELLSRCAFFLEMNLQLVNIIGETLTNLVFFCPFVSVSPIAL